MIKKSEDGYLVSNIKHKIDHEINKVDRYQRKTETEQKFPNSTEEKNVEAKTK